MMLFDNAVVSRISFQSKLVALMIFVLMAPVFLWPFMFLSFALSAALVCFIIATQNFLDRKSLAVSVLVFAALAAFKNLQGASIQGALFFSVATSALILIRAGVMVRSFHYLKMILACFIVLGAIVWFVHFLSSNSSLLLLGFVPDEYVLNQLKVESGDRYAVYPFLTRIVYGSVDGFYRFQGIFDEPGYLGTVCALIFTAGKCDLKGFSNKLVFLGGALTLSLAFYIIVAIYWLLYLIPRPDSLFKGIIYALVSVALIYSVPAGRDIADRYIIDRLAIEGGVLSGDNRSAKGLDQSFDYFLREARFEERALGLERYQLDGSSSIKQVPVTTGYFGVFLIIFVFSLLLLINYSAFNYESLIYVLVFALSAYQRPDIMNPVFVYLFIVGLLVSRSPKKYDACSRI
jgi:hypothetical protein|tara:strand:- start:4285 stop:5496 length:1212 start_codon:yes stop_codon:yes gene_type:complete